MKTNAAPVQMSAKELSKKRNNAYARKKKFMRGAVSRIRGLLMFGLCFMIIQPLLTRLSTSFMEERDLYDSTIVLLPRHLTLENFRHVFNLTEFPVSMFNTLWVSLLVSVLQVVSCTLVAYGFARYQFPLKKFWFGCVVALIIVPPQTISASLYTFFSNFDFLGLVRLFNGGKPLNIRGSLLPYAMMSLTCTGLKNGLYIYMLRQYFKGVPKSLEEAAYIDGCNTMHTFVKIMLPDAVPIILSCFLFGFVWQWTDLFYTRNFVPSQIPMFSTQLAGMVSEMAYYFSQEAGGKPIVVPSALQQQMISIGVLICSTPLIILYCFTQKTFVQSLAMTGSKE